MIKDSGERTSFSTGAVRDMHEGKGRFDLLPWYAINDVAKHCEDGAKKYGERNVDKGIPQHSLVDSAIRHLTKYIHNETDEPHLRAAAWNILWALEQETTHPDLIDLPNRSEKKEEISYKDIVERLHSMLLSILSGHDEFATNAIVKELEEHRKLFDYITIRELIRIIERMDNVYYDIGIMCAIFSVDDDWLDIYGWSELDSDSEPFSPWCVYHAFYMDGHEKHVMSVRFSDPHRVR